MMIHFAPNDPRIRFQQNSMERWHMGHGRNR